MLPGDFNRRFGVTGEGMFAEFDDSDPSPLDLVRLNDGMTSTCLDGRFPEYIDHIVVDEQAATLVVPGSLGQVQITEADAEAFDLSDHCPYLGFRVYRGALRADTV